MLDITSVITGMSGWQGGGARPAPITLIIVGAVIVVVGLLLCIIKRKAIVASCCTGGGGSGSMSSTTSASMTMTTEALNPGFKGATTKVQVQVPAGTTAGQSLLVNAPGGGMLVVKIPPKCAAFALSVPADEPASRTVKLSAKDGKFGLSLVGNAMTQGAKVASVGPGSAAADAGVALGEQVVTINGQPVPLGPGAPTAGFNMILGAGGSVELVLTTWTPSITVVPPANMA